jgi:hypothetical protein
VLISDITFTSKGVILIQDDCPDRHGGQQEGCWKAYETHQHSAMRQRRCGDSDLRKLLMSDPRIAMAATRSASIQSQDVIDLLQQLGSTELSEQATSASAKPTLGNQRCAYGAQGCQ